MLCYLKTEVVVNTDGLRVMIDELCYIVLENTLRTEYTVIQGLFNKNGAKIKVLFNLHTLSCKIMKTE